MTAGELALKALSDTTKYDALEVGHGLTDDIEEHLYKSIEIHKNRIDEPQFCVVFITAKDNLIPNLIRRKFYCWPFLPKPRPNQAVFLYNKRLGMITKRLWVLPCDAVMAELASLAVVDKRYKTMQAWSVAFFEGFFWEYIRYDQDIDMLSESEYHLQQREKKLDTVLNNCDVPGFEPFDFSKIAVKKIVNSLDAIRF